MGLFDFFRPRKPAPAPAPVVPPAASVAKERLQILLSHERADRGARSEFLPALQREILEVVAKYLVIDQEKVMVKLERGKDISYLEVNVELPGPDVPLIRPVKPPMGEKPMAEKVEEKATETGPDKAEADKPAEKPAEKLAEKAADKSADSPRAPGTGPLAHSPA